MLTHENLDRILKFGGMLVYEVSYFDEATWKIIVSLRTFNEEMAKEHLSYFNKGQCIAKIDSYMVHF